MDYQSALHYMHGRLRLGVKLGNDRMEELLRRLGSPHSSLKVIHIAGTKGKGSTVTMCASMLTAAGYRVGQYLSPYVYDVRERIQVAGHPIPEADFARLVTHIKPHIEELEHTDCGATTEFELKTAAAFCYFAEQQTDYAVVEVGLGGRLDATNIIPPPLVSVITSIGYDHMELLGNTLSLIAGEKAGIIKTGAPCVTAVPAGTDAYDVIARVCAERHVPLISAQPFDYDGDTLTLQTPRRTLSGVTLGLKGPFQRANAAAAVAALDAVSPGHLPPLSDSQMRQGLASATLPGRLELISARPTVIADGAHNEMAAEALAEALITEYNALRRRVTLIVGLKRTHDPATFLPPLAKLSPCRLIATQPQFQPRPSEDVAQAARECGILSVQEASGGAVEAARLAISQSGPDDLICVTGSFYTVGDISPSCWKSLLEERN